MITFHRFSESEYDRLKNDAKAELAQLTEPLLCKLVEDLKALTDDPGQAVTLGPELVRLSGRLAMFGLVELMEEMGEWNP